MGLMGRLLSLINCVPYCSGGYPYGLCSAVRCQNVTELGQNVNIKELRLCRTFGDSAWVFQLIHTKRGRPDSAPLGVKAVE